MLLISLLLTLLAVDPPADPAANRLDPVVVTLPRGGTELLRLDGDMSRISIADPAIADVVAINPREILVTATGIGTTSLVVWDTNNVARIYLIEVTVDADAVRRQYATLFPGEDLQVTASGNVLVLSGTVSGGEVARVMVEIARATGATVIEHFSCIRPSTTC